MTTVRVTKERFYKKPNIRRSAVCAALTAQFPDVQRLLPMGEGEDSQAFVFASENFEYIVRVNRGPDGFRKDEQAFRRFSRSCLPIPEVMTIGMVEDCFYCVSRRMPGVTLQELPLMEVALLTEKTARVLATVGESDVSGFSGFGRFDADGRGECESWRDFLVGGRELVENRGDALIEEIRHRIRELALDCPEVRHLVHGDFGSNNVLVDGGRISGVIDWSEAMIGDPLYDVANFFFWRTWLDCMEQQARYFEGRIGAGLAGRLVCYQLRIGLSEIFESEQAGDAEQAIWARRRCLEVLC